MTQETNNLTLTHERAVLLEARNLKGLAHPLRVRLLAALREGGAATASMLAEKLGESSGATSYHLRQLAEFGFIVEDPGRASGRERWWRAAHRTSFFDERTMARDPEARLLGAEYLRAVAKGHASRMLAWIEAIPGLPEAWSGAGSLNDSALRLSPEQARGLAAEMEALVARYPAWDPEEGGAESGAFVAVQFQILPRLPGAGS